MLSADDLLAFHAEEADLNERWKRCEDRPEKRRALKRRYMVVVGRIQEHYDPEFAAIRKAAYGGCGAHHMPKKALKVP